METKYARFLYISFWLLAFYFLIVQHDYSSAMMDLGIALAFDPFDQTKPWNKRPKWQRVWLIFHLSCVGLLLGLTLGRAAN